MQTTAYGKKPPLYPKRRKDTKAFLILFSLLTCYSGFSQNLTLSLKSAPLERAFREIEKKTAYRFVYTKEMAAQSNPVTVDVKNAALQRVLDLIFENQPLQFSLDETFVTVQFRTSLPVTVAATGISISGKVISENSEPLSGATVRVKGKNTGTSTNTDGNFQLNNVDEKDVLLISNVGYASEEVPVNGKKDVTIYLDLSATPLDETVVIAYGTTTKRLSTGSVSRISAEQIEKQPVSNPLAAMQGRLAGVNIVQGSGLPGSNFSVLIRGRNSIQNGTSPLYIIDGVPFLSDADRLTQLSQVNANSPFNTLNPADIQSIEVLKDADATAIYGSRGANGVILITTKKGVSGKTGIDFTYYSGWGKTTHAVDYMNTEQYLRMRREAFANDGVTPANSNAPDLLRWDTTRYTNWKKELIGGTANTTNAQLRLSGGARGTMFSISSNYYRETTVYPGDAHLSRKTVGLTLNHHSPDNRFNASVQASYGSNKSKLYQQDLTQFINLVPNAPVPYDSLGKLNWQENGAQFSNPLANILRTYDVTTDRLTGNAVVSYRIGKFQLKTSFGYNTVAADEQTALPIESQNPSFNPQGAAGFAASTTKSWVVEPQVEYNTLFGKKGSLQTLLGATWQESVTNSSNIDASGYTNDLLLNSTTGAAAITSTVYKDLYYRYQSLYSRTTFNWDKKYLLNLTYRRDGSSRFGPNRQFANFGAVGAGWVFTEEKRLSKSSRFLSFGKLRGSYGITGNDQIGDYQYLDTWSGTTYPYGGTPGLYPTRITNRDYSWEQKKNLELALDLGLFQNKALLTVNWFRSRSDNQIIQYTLPDQTGSSSILQNFPGVVENRGLEIEASATVLTKKDFSWRSSFNITVPQNRLVSFPGLNSSSYANTYVEGQPLSTLKGYRFLGVNPQTGAYSYEDINRDGSFSTLDYVAIGNTDPDYYGGFQNTFGWKGLELQVFFQFVSQQGRHLVYSTSQRFGQQINQPVFVLNHWTKAGETAPYQRYTVSPASAAWRASGLISSSSAALTDASFIRLKNASLSYSFPQRWVEKAKLQKARLYAEAQNLLTITSYEGPDPESQGRLALPPLRMVVLGIQLTL